MKLSNNMMSTTHDLLIRTIKAMAISGRFSAGFSICQVSGGSGLICSTLMNLNFTLHKQNAINNTKFLAILINIDIQTTFICCRN